MQHMPLHSRHSELVTTIMSCIPQVCRGIPTRVHWVYSSPGNDATVLAYLRILPIANENLETYQFLLLLYEFKLPPHHSSTFLSEPVVNPKITITPPTWNDSNSPGSSSYFPHSQKTHEQKGFEFDSATSTVLQPIPRAQEKDNSFNYFEENHDLEDMSTKPKIRARTRSQH